MDGKNATTVEPGNPGLQAAPFRREKVLKIVGLILEERLSFQEHFSKSGATRILKKILSTAGAHMNSNDKSTLSPMLSQKLPECPPHLPSNARERNGS